MKKWILIVLLFTGCSVEHQAQEGGVQTQVKVDFSKMHFGCDGNSITAGNQWSKTVVDILGFATHHNVAVGSAKWASYIDTQEYGSTVFTGISGGWEPTDDEVEIQKRHNNVSKVHIQKFISEVEKAETDMSASAVKNMCPTAVLTAETVEKAAMSSSRSMKD